MAIQTVTLPSGRVFSYDDRYLPQKPGMKEVGMGLLGQAAGPVTALATLYGAEQLGLLGGGSAAAGSLGAEGAAAANLGTMGSGALETFGPEMGVESALTGSTTLSSVAPWLAGAGGLLGAYDVFSHPHRNRGASALEGAGAGGLLGLSIGGPIGAGIGAGIGGISGGLFGGHKSTKQRTNEKFDALADKATDDTYKNMIESAKQQSLNAKDNYELDSKDALALSNTYAPLKTYGSDWAKLTDDQRSEVMKRALAENLIESSKGDYQFTDEERAKALYEEVLKNKLSNAI